MCVFDWTGLNFFLLRFISFEFKLIEWKVSIDNWAWFVASIYY